MSMFGLKESEVATLVRAVGAGTEASETLAREAIAERFARAAWSGIVEPGDRVALELIAAVGAASALTAVLNSSSASEHPRLAESSGDELDEALARWRPRVNSASVMLSLRQAARFGARLVVPDDVEWPEPLGDLGFHSPVALWVRGKRETASALHRSIALVGARAATGYGEHVTMEASAGLVDRGFSIVSGAAYGIDGMAHRAALASGGITVAFLAGGVDRFYPSGHDALLNRIVESGLVVSELPCGQPPTKWRFLQRNRLIAATSLATIVVEAGWRSGSLNTAGHARELGRPVGAVPGPVTSAASAGCHRLLRDGETMCVTTPEEMAELATSSDLTGGRFNADVGDSANAHPQNQVRSRAEAHPGAEAGQRREMRESEVRQSPEVTRLLDALSTRSARHAGDIASRAGLSAGEVQSLLGRLALEGMVVERERGWVKSAQPRDVAPK